MEEEGRHSGSWMRFRYSDSDAVWKVEGDCRGLLGVPALELTESPSPLDLLPGSVSGVLLERMPSCPVRVVEERFEAVIFPCGTHFDVVLFGRSGSTTESGYRLVTELGAGVVALDPDSRIRIWNRRMESLFGIAEEAAVGRRLDETLQPPLLYSWKTVVDSALKGREAVVHCVPAPNRRVTATFSRGGPGVAGTFFDTSESYVAEKRLRTNRRMNQAYFQTIGTGLVLFSEDYRVLSSNRFFGNLFGVNESLVGMPLYEILPGESFRELDGAARGLWAGGEETAPAVTVRFTGPDGNSHVITQVLRSLKPEDQDVPYMVGIFSEETEAVVARENLESNRDRMHSVLELAECLDTSPVTASGDRIAGILCETLGAVAVAVYFYDPYATTLLAGRNGGWIEGAPPDDFSELRLPASVWTTLPGSLLKGHEMGILEGLFDNCFVLPLGSGSDSAGFIVSVGVPEAQLLDIYTTGGIVSSLLQTGILRHMERSEKEQLEFQRSGDRQFLEALLSSVDSPVAVFSEDWNVLHWNEAMEKVTGMGREAVTAHPDMATERLFGPVGGTPGLRKLLRTGLTEPQGTWVLEGSDPPVTLRVRKAGNPGGGVHSAAYVLTGLDSSDRIGFERAQEAVAGYEALTRGSADLLSAPGWQEIADIAARVCLAVSGAVRVEVKLAGRAEAAAGAGPARDAPVPESWSETIGSPSRSIGECLFTGGRKSQAVTSFLGGVGRAVSEMENRAIGAGLMELSAGSRGRFVFSLPDGSVLFSTWPVSVLRSDSGTSVGGLFHVDSLETARRMMRKAAASGRASGTLRDGEGTDWSLRVVALSGEGTERILLWWPVEPDGDAAPDPFSTAEDLEREILRLMASSSGTGASVLRSVKKSLGGDTAMAAQLQAVIYEAMSAGRLLGYLELLETASRECSDTFPVDDLVRLTMMDLADGGHRPPDLEVADGLPDAAGSPYVTKELLARACRLFAGPAGASRLTVELESVARMEPGTVPDLYPWTTDELILLKLEGSAALPCPPEPGDLLAMIHDGLMGPPVELGLIRHIMRLTGGDCLHGGGKGELVFVLPVAGDPAGP